MAYTPIGPWTDNNPPGIDQVFLDALEAFLVLINSASTDSHITANGSGIMTLLGLIANGSLQINPTPITLNGATSGTAKLYQPLTGTFKLIFVDQQNMRNNSGVTQTITFPTPFTSCVWIATGSANLFQLLSSGSPITVQSMSSFGNQAGNTSLGGPSIANAGACDAIGFQGGQASTHTGPIVIFGI